MPFLCTLFEALDIYQYANTFQHQSRVHAHFPAFKLQAFPRCWSYWIVHYHRSAWTLQEKAQSFMYKMPILEATCLHYQIRFYGSRSHPSSLRAGTMLTSSTGWRGSCLPTYQPFHAQTPAWHSAWRCIRKLEILNGRAECLLPFPIWQL